VRKKSGSRSCGCRLFFYHAKDRAALDNLRWAESAGEEKTLSDTRRRLDGEDAAHDLHFSGEAVFTCTHMPIEQLSFS
jgi:predicted  nucleic acid-binding Zn-ribbon protein